LRAHANTPSTSSPALNVAIVGAVSVSTHPMMAAAPDSDSLR
jgi:hypothetical protein